MSVLNATLPCPCRTWRCRAIYAARVLGALAAVALIAAELLVFMNTIHDPIDAVARPAATSSTTAMLQPAVTAVQQLAAVHAAPSVNWTDTTLHALVSFEAHPTPFRLDRLVADGFHLAAKPDQADIGQLYADFNGEGSHSKYLSDDEQYVYEDLTNCSGC